MHDIFPPFLLKLFSTVAGTTTGQEGGAVTGKGFHLRAGLPAHGQALQQNAGLQAGHTAPGQEGLSETFTSLLPCSFIAICFPQTALFRKPWED